MSLNINRPHQALMNVVFDWAGNAIDALAPMASIGRPGGYRDREAGLPNDGAKLAGDDKRALNRAIRWAGGRDVSLHWKLPSPGC